MIFDLCNKISSKFKHYKVEKIASGASKKLFFRLSNDSHSVICMDFKNEKKEYVNYIKIHSYLSKINISIPSIYERNDNYKILILEDLGNLRFDKILSDYKLKDLLTPAVKTLIILKNEINFNTSLDLDVYDFNRFKTEISEFPNYYYPYIHKKEISQNLREEFYECWRNSYDSINFDFSNFVHKDFNINNLLYLPLKKDQLKCGVIDFQNAFWGESSWDLFSLLEDSRVYFDDQYNDFFIKYYFKNSNQKITIEEFREKYYILNCSRQTRLLGRWVKLSTEFNQNSYLKFIQITKKRLLNGIEKLHQKELKLLYKDLIPDFNDA